jgi:putative transposase
MIAMQNHRRSIRLPGANYAQPGAYFITICTQDKACVFGTISLGVMEVNTWGLVVKQCWESVLLHFPLATLDAFVVMPNHIHGIIVISDHATNTSDTDSKKASDDRRGMIYHALAYDSERQFSKPIANSLSSIIGTFKAAVTRQIRQLESTNPFHWQRNYYEHIIRDEADLDRIRGYIKSNPERWKQDSLYN